MKNVAKKSTSLKPNCPTMNEVQERLSNGLITGAKHDIECTEVEMNSPDGNSNDNETRDPPSVDGINDTETRRNPSVNSLNVDENSTDSLLDVSCVNVADDAIALKSPGIEEHGLSSRPSTPVSGTGTSSNHLKDSAVNGVNDVDCASDDEVIICDRSSPDVDHMISKSSNAMESSISSSSKQHGNGPVCRVENFEIFENKTEVEPDEPPTKDDKVEAELEDEDVEVIELDGSALGPPVNSTDPKSNQRLGLKRVQSEPASNDVGHAKRSRLEAAEAEVLTSFVSSQHATERGICLTAKQLNDLVLKCIEEYLTKSHSSVIKQLKNEIEQLKKSRDEWKEIANKLRKEVAAVQTTQQRNERRRASATRVQKRSVACQASEKATSTSSRSPARSVGGTPDASKTVAQPTQLLSLNAAALNLQSPSILPPASANLAASQRLKLIHQQNSGPRMTTSGIMNGPMRPNISPNVSGAVLNMRPQVTSSKPDVMIDLTDEEDVRTKQTDSALPNGLLNSIIQPTNVVLAPNNSAYLLCTQPTRSAMMKTNSAVDVNSVNSLPTLALNTSINAGDGYHSLPSLVSVNNRHSGAVLQVVNMRPPPPLTSAPLRSTTLPVLPAQSAPRLAMSPAVQHHPAPLPAVPNIQSLPSNAKQIPPKPTLKLSRVAQGIVLSWNATIGEHQEEPSTYQLYAYQQGNEPPNSSLWKKVGNVKALALPMACTLTQFQVGNKYHFAVRAVDQYGRVGPFSEPGSIHLEGGST